jgi:filamentous hemagglutinin
MPGPVRARTLSSSIHRLIASVFGGAGEGINLVPMDKILNGSGGRWYELERSWMKALDSNKSVKVDIRPVYGNGGSKPTEFVVKYEIDGKLFTPPPIKNTPTGN